MKKSIVVGIILLFLLSSLIPITSSYSSYETNKAHTVRINENGTLSGYVTDSAMNPIEGARVRVYFHETYEENYTDSSGYYHVTNIPICYCLKNATASKDGYTTEWVLLAIGENTTHDFVLTLLGKTLYVGGTGPGNYSKIQDAINDASDGDTVFVYNDSSPYYEYKIVISKSINLIGEDKNTTIIDGGGIGDSVLKFYADWINISGFAIQNSTGSFLEDAGIEIHSNYSTISGNIIINNINGIIIHSSNNNTFSDNTITNNEFCGIYLQNSSDNTITGNTFISNIRVGLYLSNSNRNTITNNSFFNDGISVTNSYQNSVYDNTVNGKPLVYLEEESNKIIENAGQIVLVNCDNITIQNQEFSNTDICIELLNTDNCLISGNIFNSNDNGGILLSHSSNNHISNNTVSANSWGISLSYSSNNIIFGNTISNNTHLGLVIQKSDNNTVSDNIILNHNIGLEEASSCDNIIFGNTISNNEVGINLYASSDNNVIYHNNFIENTQNADDECINTWDNEEKGNYWDDYEERYPDAHKKWLKGIWDTPYDIPGGGNHDRFPLTKPYSKSKSYVNPLFLQFLENHLNMFPILRHLLKL